MTIFQVNLGKPVAALIINLQSSLCQASSVDRTKLFVPT